jgi:hypothetical protein
MRKGCCHTCLMCMYLPLNGVLGAAGVAFVALGLYIFIACLPAHVVVPNALDWILLITGTILAVLHFGVLCCNSNAWCSCAYRLVTSTLAACELVLTLLFFIPGTRADLLADIGTIVGNSSTSAHCNLTGLVGNVTASASASNAPVYVGAVMLGLVFVQLFLVFLNSCHSDALRMEQEDDATAAQREALMEQKRASTVYEDAAARQYKDKYSSVFDKYKRRKGGVSGRELGESA